MTDQTQQIQTPDLDPTSGPSSVPVPAASTSQPPSPSSTAASVAGTPPSDAGLSQSEVLEWPAPNMLTRPPKSAEDLRHDYGEIQQQIHRAQKLLYERNYNLHQHPVLDILAGSHVLMRHYLPPGAPEAFTLDDYRLALSDALRGVREAFVEGEVERKEMMRKERLEGEALRRKALEKIALMKETLEKEVLKKEAPEKVSIGPNSCGH